MNLALTSWYAKGAVGAPPFGPLPGTGSRKSTSTFLCGEELKLSVSNTQSPTAACRMDCSELEFRYEPAWSLWMRRVGTVSTPRPSIVDATGVSDGGLVAVAGASRSAAATMTINALVARCMRLLFILDSLLLLEKSRPPFLDNLSGNDGLRLLQ